MRLSPPAANLHPAQLCMCMGSDQDMDLLVVGKHPGDRERQCKLVSPELPKK